MEKEKRENQWTKKGSAQVRYLRIIPSVHKDSFSLDTTGLCTVHRLIQAQWGNTQSRRRRFSQHLPTQPYPTAKEGKGKEEKEEVKQGQVKTLRFDSQAGSRLFLACPSSCDNNGVAGGEETDGHMHTNGAWIHLTLLKKDRMMSIDEQLNRAW